MVTMVTSPVPNPPQHDAAPSPPTPLPKRASLAAPSGSRRASGQTYGKNRMSTHSLSSTNRSRPVSHIFPYFPSSLSYAAVRDFAYPASHPLHYGAAARDPGGETPTMETRRLSDPPGSWDTMRATWPAPHWNPESMYGQQQLPAIAFGDGPPYSEDEDLHSPIVTTARHRKHRSDSRRAKSPGGEHNSSGVHENGKGVFIGLNADGKEIYFIKSEHPDEDGREGQYVTYPPHEGGSYGHGSHSNSHFTTSLQGQPHGGDFELESDDDNISEDGWHDPSRYSRDYQFTIVSPDEEMHGKAVALFDFTREHENELPLKEGQVILVSYRHGQGWLVAEDPRTGESGLVPEEFVRLVRDIEGGLNSLNGALNPPFDSPTTDTMELETPRPHTETTDEPELADHPPDSNGTVDTTDTGDAVMVDLPAQTPQDHTSNNAEKNAEKHASKDKHPPVVSTFSTSSRDLAPYPSHLLSGHQHTRSTPTQIDLSECANEIKAQPRRAKSISKQG